MFTWISDKTGNRIGFSRPEIILGIVPEELQIFNLIFMITSRYIYTRRCLEKDALILTQLIYNIKDYYYAEKQIATDNNSLLRFNDKWELVTECFQ